MGRHEKPRVYESPEWVGLAVIVIVAAIAVLAGLFVLGAIQSLQPPKAEPCTVTFDGEVTCIDVPVSTGLGGGWR